MKQIYDFERGTPPELSERALRRKLEKQRVRRQTALLALAAVFSQAVMLLAGALAINAYPPIAVFCFVYAAFAAAGGGVIAVVFTRKGEITI